MIRTREEAEEWARLVNRHTDSCATVREEAPPPRRVWATWTAKIRKGVGGWYCHSARPNRGRTILAAKLPADVREYLCLTTGQRLDVPPEWVPAVDADILRVSHRQGSTFVTFTMQRQFPRPARLGILLSCEVGESGSGPTEFLPLPVSEAAMVKAREALEDEAKNIEVETGWAECADTYYRALVIDGVPAASPDMIEAAFAPPLFFEEED